MSGPGRDSSDPPPPSQDTTAREHALALVGQVLAERYRIHALVAMGGMGAVLRGEHIHMRKRVAVKVLHASSQGLPELVARFERESIVGAHVRHPNVVSASDFGRLADGSYYLVMEFVHGATLSERIERGPLEPARAVHITTQIAAALAAIHKLGIVHRDLKPQNVMIVPEDVEVVKLIDFGFAKVPETFAGAKEPAVPLTSAGIVFGTVAYMAPEAALGMQAVTHRSDLYALGVLLYEMLTGKHPFEADDPGRMFLQHRMLPPPPFAERAPEVRVPAALEAIAMRLLEKMDTARYESAEAVIRALEQAVAAPPQPPPRAPPSGGSRRASQVGDDEPEPARRSPVGWFVAIAAIGAIGAAAYELGDRLPLVGAWLGDSATTPRVVRPTGSAVPLRSAPTRTVADASASASASAPAPRATVAAGDDAGVIDAGVSDAPSPISAAGDLDASAQLLADAGTEPGPPAMTGEGARWRRILLETTDAGDPGRGADALLALARADPGAFRERDVAVGAAAVAVAIEAVAAADTAEATERARADAVFEALSGAPPVRSAGPDILYWILVHHPGSPGARRATAMIDRPEVADRATPAARVAFALLRTPCAERPRLYERAAADGDGRALATLESMRSPGCDPARDCCAGSDGAAAVASAAIAARILSTRP